MTDPTRRGFLRRLAGAVAAIVAVPVALEAAAAPAKTVLPTADGLDYAVGAEGYAEMSPALRIGRLANGVNGMQIGQGTVFAGVYDRIRLADRLGLLPGELDGLGADDVADLLAYERATFPTVWSGSVSSSVYHVESITAGGTSTLFDRAAPLNVEQRAPDRIGGTFVFTAKPGSAQFEPGDVVRMKAIQPDGSVGDCWATIDGRGGCLYAATMKLGTPGAVFPRGTAVVGYGPA